MELDVPVAWTWVPLVAPVAVPVAEAVLLKLRITLWAAQSFDAKSSVFFRSSGLQSFSISGSSEVSHDLLLQMHLKLVVSQFVLPMLSKAGPMAH